MPRKERYSKYNKKREWKNETKWTNYQSHRTEQNKYRQLSVKRNETFHLIYLTTFSTLTQENCNFY